MGGVGPVACQGFLVGGTGVWWVELDLFSLETEFIHDHWKNHSFDQMDLCQQNDVSAF